MSVIVIMNADMPEEMQQDAVDCATSALENYNESEKVAAFIKQQLDMKYNPTWNSIVGSDVEFAMLMPRHYIFMNVDVNGGDGYHRK